jgi:hypothetical protein
MGSNLEHHVRQARNGNKQALETVVGRLQKKVYGLALRMLGNDENVEDETREILIPSTEGGFTQLPPTFFPTASHGVSEVIGLGDKLAVVSTV